MLEMTDFHRRVLFSTTSAPTVTYMPTSTPSLYPVMQPTPLPRSSIGLIVMWICVMFIFVSIGITIYRCLSIEVYPDDEQQRRENERRLALNNGLQVDGDAAAQKFMSAIPVKLYHETVAFQTSLTSSQQAKKEETAVVKLSSGTSDISGHHSHSGIYDGPLSPAARLRAAASLGGPVDDVAVGMGNEEELCSICLGEFESEERVKELNCLHVYHEECLDQWLKRSTLCPLCKRKAIPPVKKKPLKPANASSVNRTLDFDDSVELSVLYGDGQEGQDTSLSNTPSSAYSRMFSSPSSVYPTLFTPSRWSLFTPTSTPPTNQSSQDIDPHRISSTQPIPEEDPAQLSPSPNREARSGVESRSLLPRTLSLDVVVESVNQVTDNIQERQEEGESDLWQVLEAGQQTGVPGIDDAAVATTLPSTPRAERSVVDITVSAPTTPQDTHETHETVVHRVAVLASPGDETETRERDPEPSIESSSVQTTPTRPQSRRGGSRRNPVANSQRRSSRPTSRASSAQPQSRGPTVRPTTNNRSVSQRQSGSARRNANSRSERP